MTGSFTTHAGGGFTFSVFHQPAEPAVYRSEEGTGYPSASRALARRAPNQNDANGYYASLGIPPWSDVAEIKRAGRKLLRDNHPDFEPEGITDEERAGRLRAFDRIKEILTVLTNPVLKANYDSIPKGRKLIDSQVRADMEERGISFDDPGIQKFANADDEEPEPEDDKPNRAERRRRKRNDHNWDYLAVNHSEMDLINVQEWYGYLLDAAPLFRYEGIFKVLMHDGKTSAFKPMGGVMLIPRRWRPSLGMAFQMLLTHLGWPDVSKPRYPVRTGDFERPTEESFAKRWSGVGTGILSLRQSTPPVGG